jgi:hypothetical protein
MVDPPGMPDGRHHVIYVPVERRHRSVPVDQHQQSHRIAPAGH